MRCCMQFADVFGEASDRRNEHFYILGLATCLRYVDTGMEKMDAPWIYI